MAVYVSTSCLTNGDNIFKVLDIYAKAGLKHISLGSTHKYTDNLSPDKFKGYDFNLICHHYFPPAKEPIMVNLASQDPTILKRSREQIRQSIDFCFIMGISFFPFHAGFRAEPDEKLNFKGQPVAPYESAFATFVESVNEVNRYAEVKKVKIAIENNVLAEYNLVDGQNPYLLLCEAGEFEKFLSEVQSGNVGVLLDLGHLKVTSHCLSFNRYEFIDKVKDRVFGIHAHENNGHIDEHRELDQTSWCFEVISRECFANLPVVLESLGLTINQIMKQVHSMEKILGRNKLG